MAPLTRAELSFKYVFDSEYRYVYAGFEAAIKTEIEESLASNLIYRLLLKKNKIHNKIYANYVDIVKVSQCDVSMYLSCLDAYHNNLSEETSILSLEFLDDPLGTILLNIETPDYSVYPQRVFYKEALRRLVLVKYAIYNKKIETEKIQDFLNNLSPTLKSPFNGTIIKWQAEQKNLAIYKIKDNSQMVSLKL